MGLCFHTSTWADALWRGHLATSWPAQETLHVGTQRQAAFPAFADDLHAVLYLRHAPPSIDDAPTWATQLHTEAQNLPEFQQLKARCAQNGFAAGLATASLLEALLPLVPQESPPDSQSAPSAPAGQGQPQPGDGPGQPGDGAQGDAAAMRRALRQAVRQTTRALDEAEAGLEGLAPACGRHAGREPGQPESLQDLQQVRALYALLRDHPTLRHIAELAGRLQRLGATHKRCKVQPAVGQIRGLTRGGDLDRILPAELAGLRATQRLMRVRTLSTILERRALQYIMRGDEPETRGPIIVLVDESGSMNDDGKGLWAKAVALALLTTATQQRRAWHLVGFSTRVTHEAEVLPGQGTPDTLRDVLLHGCRGGTDFDPPLLRALDILQASLSMRKADIILITDGESDVSPDVAEAVLTARTQASLHLYAILVGGDATGTTLAPIASQCYRVSHAPAGDSAMVAEVIALG